MCVLIDILLLVLYSVYIACLIRPLVYTIFIGAFLLGAGGGGKTFCIDCLHNHLVTVC